MAPLFSFFSTWGLRDKVLFWTLFRQSRIQKGFKILSDFDLHCRRLKKKKKSAFLYRILSQGHLIDYYSLKSSVCFIFFSGLDHLGHHLQWPILRCGSKVRNSQHVYSIFMHVLINDKHLPLTSSLFKKKKKAINVNHHWTPIISIISFFKPLDMNHLKWIYYLQWKETMEVGWGLTTPAHIKEDVSYSVRKTQVCKHPVEKGTLKGAL